MATDTSKPKNLTVDLLLGFEYYIAAFKTTQLIHDYLWELGYDLTNDVDRGRGITVLEKINVVAEELTGAYQDIADFVIRPPKSWGEWTKVLVFCGKLAETSLRIKTVLEEEGIEPSGDMDWGELAGELAKLISLKLAELFLPQVYHALVLATVIQPGKGGSDSAVRDDNGRIIRYPHSRTKVEFDRLKLLFDSPGALLREEYLELPEGESPPDPGDLEDAQLKKISDKLFKRLSKFLTTTGANTVYGLKPTDWLDFADPIAREINDRTLSFWYEFLDEQIEVGASLAFRRNADGTVALAVVPVGGVQHDFEIKGWTLRLDSTGFIAPFVVNGPEEADSETAVDLAFVLSKGDEKEKAYVIGAEKGTHLELGRVRLEGGIRIARSKRELGILLEATKSKWVFNPEDADNFLRKVLPDKGFQVIMDLGIGWSEKVGFYIKGGAGLEVELPRHDSLGNFLKITAVQLGINVSNAELRLYGALSVHTRIGPVEAVIDNTGLQALWKFPDQQAQSPDSTTFDLGFKAPKGVGFKINASVLKGSGYLFFDQENGQYAGVAELVLTFKKKEYQLKAIGIISTQMPDGSDGYSFLLLISVEFTPKHLFWGIHWTGIGGLVGLHRTMNADRLQRGVKDRTLDDILFPENPLLNARRIITNAAEAFPPQEGRYTFGLIGKFNWGSNNLVTLELGLIVEGPSPWRLAILGVLKADQSKKIAGKERSIFKIQASFVGIIDFDREFFSFDAGLFDSSILGFRFEGDIALRYQWGDPKLFLLSVGGFHPEFYEIPGDLRPLDRIMLPLIDKESARVVITFYLAITPNTFQFGAGVAFFFKISKFNVLGEFSFDALFHSRSDFVILLSVMIDVRWGSRSLFGVAFKGRLTGTSPWHIVGEAKIKLLFWSKTIPIDKTYGDAVDIPPVPVELLGDLKNELEDDRNWQELQPSSSRLLVTVRPVEPEGGPSLLLLHPNGGLEVQQGLIPLETKLDKFGTSPVQGTSEFRLAFRQGANPNSTGETVKDAFAPAMYLELSDEEKLSRKSFERFPAGVKMASADQLSLGKVREKEVVYEQKIYDGSEEAEVKTDQQSEDRSLFIKWSRNGAVAQSAFGQQSRDQTGKAMNLKEPAYRIVDKRDLSFYEPAIDKAYNQAQAHQQLKTVIAGNPRLARWLTVVPEHEL